MKRRSLIDTNPHLKDPANRKKLVERSVRSSCGVEGIKVDLNRKPIVIPRRSQKE